MNDKVVFLIDDTETDSFSEVFHGTIEEAITEAESSWKALSDHDKKRRVSYGVGVADSEDAFYEVGYDTIIELVK